mgnify:CR=1 FL=1
MLRAKDVMTTPVVSVETGSTIGAVADLLVKHGISAIPVIDGDNDHVIGIVHIKYAMSVPHERRGAVPVRALMAAPVFVPSSVGLDRLLGELQRGGLQMAVVVDEFGAVDGIVTLEDLIEEIVGEISDEYDRQDRPEVEPLQDGTFRVDARMGVDDFAETFGVDLDDEDDIDTVGGLLAKTLGRVPIQGSRVTGSSSAHVEDVSGCTKCDAEQFFSYRRESRTGRMASLVWLQQ